MNRLLLVAVRVLLSRVAQKGLLGLVLLGVAGYVISTTITIFVVPPIGMLPDGRTVILLRHSAVLKFVDSADAICDRKMDGVSLLCRAIAMGTVAKDNEILMRLPYSQSLYLVSTGGKTWSQ
jgi:hypothetical protein